MTARAGKDGCILAVLEEEGVGARRELDGAMCLKGRHAELEPDASVVPARHPDLRGAPEVTLHGAQEAVDAARRATFVGGVDLEVPVARETRGAKIAHQPVDIFHAHSLLQRCYEAS